MDVDGGSDGGDCGNRTDTYVTVMARAIVMIMVIMTRMVIVIGTVAMIVVLVVNLEAMFVLGGCAHI